MDGVEILAEHHISDGSLGIEMLCGLLAVAAFALAIMFIVETVNGDIFPWGGIGMTILSVAVSLLFCWVGYKSSEKLNTYSTTEYLVTVDDSVGFNEFTDRYEIVDEPDENSKIWTVREKTENTDN